MGDQTESPMFGIMALEPETKTDDNEESTDDGVLFYVNKSGFPINNYTWERMWTHVGKLHPDGEKLEKEIRNKKTLPEVCCSLDSTIYGKFLDKICF